MKTRVKIHLCLESGGLSRSADNGRKSIAPSLRYRTELLNPQIALANAKNQRSAGISPLGLVKVLEGSYGKAL